MTWIYLSPHFDDAVYSCGGLISQQAQAGQRVEIWTVCAGEIPPVPLTPFAQELHDRWGTGSGSVAARRGEDEAACRILDAHPRHFSLPDCIYRRLPGPEAAPVITSQADLWQPVAVGEAPLVEQVTEWLRQGLVGSRLYVGGRRAHLVCPLTVGGHVDHRLVRGAAEMLGLKLWYYADYPYSAKGGFEARRYLANGRRGYARAISPAALSDWQAAAAAYATQLSSFWRDEEEMRAAIANYAARPEGHSLWGVIP
jgi:LmbE family N-acetylglucosaminyl deacetylase